MTVYRFPYDQASDQVLAAAAELDPTDLGVRAEHLREVAGSIADHREARERENYGVVVRTVIH